MKLRVCLLASGVLAVFVLACGGGDDDNGASENPPADGAAPTATRPPAVATNAPPTIPASTTTAPPTQAAGDACGLVTKADIQTALGENVSDGEGQPGIVQDLGLGIRVAVSSCNFDSLSSAKGVTVDLGKISGGAESQYRQVFDQAICAGKEKISGVGDVACWYDSDRREIQVLKGASFVRIVINESSGPDRADALRNLVSKALTKV
jgi:hypothetical protein